MPEHAGELMRRVSEMVTRTHMLVYACVMGHEKVWKMKTIVAGFAALAVSTMAGAVLAQPGHYGWDSPMGWGGWWMGPVMMLAGVAVLVLIIIGLWRLIAGSSDRGQGREVALNVLRDRFARGEIDEEEFEARKKALRR